MDERLKPTVDPDIEEYNKKAVEEGKPTFEEMWETVEEFIASADSITLKNLNRPRTELVEELYRVVKAVEKAIEDEEGKFEVSW